MKPCKRRGWPMLRSETMRMPRQRTDDVVTHPAFSLLLACCGFVWASGCHSQKGNVAHERWSVIKDPSPKTYRYTTMAHLPADQIGMATLKRDIKGKASRVPCTTCHLLVKPQAHNAKAKHLEKFHKKIILKHGGQTCRTCHAPPTFDSFRLSSDERIPYHRVMELCGQCHSRQKQDYDHGAHGGMMGYWDLDRGPQNRNTCIDCHNPHRPALPRVIPAALSKQRSHAFEEGTDE